MIKTIKKNKKRMMNSKKQRLLSRLFSKQPLIKKKSKLILISLRLKTQGKLLKMKILKIFCKKFKAKSKRRIMMKKKRSRSIISPLSKRTFLI